MKHFVVVRAEGYMTSRPASSVFVYTKTIFALQNTCWEIPNPFKSAPSRRRLRDGIAE